MAAAKIERWNIAAGELNRRVTIQTKRVTALSGRGAPTRDWDRENVIEVWAKVEQLSGRKLELARQLVATCTHLVTMRVRPLDVKEQRIIYRGKVFGISNAIDVEEQGVRLEVACTELKDEVP